MRSIKFNEKKAQDVKLFNCEGVFYNRHSGKWAVVFKNNSNQHFKKFKCVCQCTTKEQAQINFDKLKNK